MMPDPVCFQHANSDSGCVVLKTGRSLTSSPADSLVVRWAVRRVVKAIDAHVGGAPLRLLVDGVPTPAGSTMARKRDWMTRYGDDLRRAVMLGPRGHVDMCGALLTEPVSAGADAGLLFMDASGFVPLSGHGIVAATTIAIEHGLIITSSESEQAVTITFDTPVGSMASRARIQRRGTGPRVDSVAFTTLPSFVMAAGQHVRVGSRVLRVDIAFGGLFFAIVDTEVVGIPLERDRLLELRRLGLDIRAAINADGRIQHPLNHSIRGVTGVIFTGPPHDPEAHLRNVTIFGEGAVDWSPCSLGTAAVMAVLDAMGLLADEQSFVHESVIGSLHHGRIVRRTQVGDYPAISPEVAGTAWITGEHTFFLDDDDSFRDGGWS